MTMSTTAIDTISSIGAGALTPPSSNLGKQEFLQLLVTQLKHQDPLDPMNDREFISQMAQLSTLETTNTLAAQVGEMVAGQQRTQALQMVGHDIDYRDAGGKLARGRVTGARLDGSTPVLLVGETEVPVAFVQTVL
jgi:flagellar basal-body rod modification protein FlgD